MCSYSSVTMQDNSSLPANVPACADSYLLNGIARAEWAWDGYVLSDAGAVAFIGSVDIGGVQFGHGYSANDTDSAVKALSGGCDVELTCCGAPATYWRLPDAVRAGVISESALDMALNRTLPWRFAVGALDPRGSSPYDNLTSTKNATTAGQLQLALEAAVQAAVLLKNDGLLPLSPAALAGKRLCVLGPNANNTLSLMGGYVNTNAGGPGIITVHAGLVAALPGCTVVLAEGCNTTGCIAVDPAAIAAAATCDVNIYVGGLTAYAYSKNESTACGCPAGDAIEGECCDRRDVALPGAQLPFIQALAALGKPLIVLSINAGMLDFSFPQRSKSVNALLTTAYPGQMGGAALATLLTGGASPSGRLVTTYYGGLGPGGNVTSVIGDISDYSMTNRTYKYYTGPVQYTFGYGLSYTRFSYALAGLSTPRASAAGTAGLTIGPCDVLNISYAVTNTASTWPGAADEVAQLYVSLKSPSVSIPPVNLVSFDRLSALTPGQTRLAYMLLLPEDHSVMRPGDWARQVEPGVRNMWLGAASPGAVPTGITQPPGVSFAFTVAGPTTLVEQCPQGQPKQVWKYRESGEGGAQVWAPINEK
jgi:beta-glucosidase